MKAVVAKHRADDALGRQDGKGARLSGFLGATAARHPQRVAFLDQSGREDWSGRPRIAWSYGFAHHVVENLAGFLQQLNLPKGAVIGLCMPNGSEICLAFLAIERAGFIPCLLPLAFEEDQLAAAVEAAHVQAVITQSIVADQRPAEMFRHIAARYYNLRFLCAFGPLVPEGVVDLDQIIAAPDGFPLTEAAMGAESGVLTFTIRNGVPVPIFRSGRSLLAAAVNYLMTSKPKPAARILSLLPPDDLIGLVTGLVTSVVSGSTLECHGLFKGKVFADTLEDSRANVVAPGWMESFLLSSNLYAKCASIVLIHRPIVRFKSTTSRIRDAIDVLSLGEITLLARERDSQGRIAMTLGSAHPFEKMKKEALSTDRLLDVFVEEDGELWVRGQAADIAEWRHPQSPIRVPASQWRQTGLIADIFAGRLIGIEEK